MLDRSVFQILLLLNEWYSIFVLEFAMFVFHTDHTYVPVLHSTGTIPQVLNIFLITGKMCKIVVYVASCKALQITLVWSIDLGGFSHVCETEN